MVSLDLVSSRARQMLTRMQIWDDMSMVSRGLALSV